MNESMYDLPCKSLNLFIISNKLVAEHQFVFFFLTQIFTVPYGLSKILMQTHLLNVMPRPIYTSLKNYIMGMENTMGIQSITTNQSKQNISKQNISNQNIMAAQNILVKINKPMSVNQ